MVLTENFLYRAEATEEDEEAGLRHLLLCRLILGKPEEIISGSKQAYPSSVEFDSGVDDVQNPRKYIIWSSTMNSYILPTYIVSFKSPRLTGIYNIFSSFNKVIFGDAFSANLRMVLFSYK